MPLALYPFAIVICAAAISYGVVSVCAPGGVFTPRGAIAAGALALVIALLIA